MPANSKPTQGQLHADPLRKRIELKLPQRAVKPISALNGNVGFGAYSGPSRGDRCRRAIRPIEAFAIAFR
jgi:hypothetical protein